MAEPKFHRIRPGITDEEKERRLAIMADVATKKLNRKLAKESMKKQQREISKKQNKQARRQKITETVTADSERNDDMALRIAAMRRLDTAAPKIDRTVSSPYADTAIVEDWREQN